jgi:hypothetical protein
METDKEGGKTSDILFLSNLTCQPELGFRTNLAFRGSFLDE